MRRFAPSWLCLATSTAGVGTDVRGICGMAGPDAEYVMVQNMCAGLAHRGPDGEGIYEDTGVVF